MIPPGNSKLINLLFEFGEKSEARFWLAIGLIYSPALTVYGLAIWLAWRAFR